MENNLYRDMCSKLHTSINEEELIMHQKRNGKPRVFALVLAAALVLALAVSAAAIYRGHLQDLVLQSPETPALEGTDTPTPESRNYDPLRSDYEMISVQGYAGSPEYQAALAWAEFQHSYDRDGAELQRVGNAPTGFEEKYRFNGYHVYTQEMADRLDEIAAQYEQWEYQTACGETVLLALGPEKALILADLAQSFVTVNILAGTRTPDPFTNAQLEALADRIDFSLL